MKTIQPKDYSKTPEQYLIESRMGKGKQRMYLFRLFLFGLLVWAAGWCMAELWEIYLEAQK